MIRGNMFFTTLTSSNKYSILISQKTFNRIFVILMLVGSIIISPVSVSFSLAAALEGEDKRVVGTVDFMRSGIFDEQSAKTLEQASRSYNIIGAVTFATNLAKKGVQVQEIADLLKSKKVQSVEFLINQGINYKNAITLATSFYT
ncbi:MAG: hypothetical protein JSS34_06055 [Proteobacteria bacterium]|nr:hypothetical protein [Pseudomonadota bacterium]